MTKEFIVTFVIVVLFIISALLSQYFQESLQIFVESYGTYGGLYYILITIGSVVFAPLNTLFLLPIATAIWGPFVAAILSIVGWTIGALIAYTLARRFGHPLVTRLANIKRLEEISRVIPKRNIFLWIVLARMAVPVDILSYTLGLFINVPYMTYTLATLIGVSPFAFFFAYASDAHSILSVFALGTALVTVSLGIYWFKKASKVIAHEQ